MNSMLTFGPFTPRASSLTAKSFGIMMLMFGVLLASSETAQGNDDTDRAYVNTMREAFHDDDLSAFMDAVVATASGLSLFEQDIDAFDLLCQAVALDEREAFLEALLVAGLDPNLRFRSQETMSGSLLRCATSLGNDSAFATLVGAGARTADPQCLTCEGGARFTLILHAQRWPKIVDVILEDRPLMEAEIRHLALVTGKKVLRGTHKGVPTNVYYANLLAEMGVDVVPATRESSSD